MEALLDFETASPADLKEVGAWSYWEHVATDIICLSFSWRGKVHTWRPEQTPEADALLRKLAAHPKIIFVRHGDFEVAGWRNQMVPLYNFPDVENSRWADTITSCAVRALPLSLDDSARVLRLPMQKDSEGSKFTKSLSKPNKRGYYNRSPETYQRVVDYCEQDIRAELELHERLGPLPPEHVEPFNLHQLMTQRGLRVDLGFIAAAQQVVDRASVPLVSRFRELTDVNPTQIQKVRDWCKANGTSLPNLGAETIVRVLGGSADGEEIEIADDPGAYCPPLSDSVREALSIRQLIGSSSIKKLGRMAACVCADGRARGLSQYNGAMPGRSTGRLYNPYNFPRGVVTLDGAPPDPQIVVDAIMTGDPDYVEATLGAPIQAVVSGLRHAIVPDRGSVFLSGDYAGIQARVVLALSGQHDKTSLMAAGADVYCDMAGQIYNRPITKEDKPERQAGKNSVLGLGFQMGARKFHLKYCRNQPFEFAERVVNVYRKQWAPLVPKVWWNLQDAALSAVQSDEPREAYGVEYRKEDGWLTARLPSGRKLWYWNPQLTRRAMPWDDTDIRDAWAYQAMKQGRLATIDAFGGQLTENVVMGIEVDIMRHGWANCERNGFPIVHECYDELVAEVPEKGADLEGFLECMRDTPDWVKDLQIPVAVEGWSGDRYRK